MQVVKWGKKQRTVKVPVGWVFIKDGKPTHSNDMYFNLGTHAWTRIDPTDVGDPVGPDGFEVAVRELRFAESCDIDKDPHLIKLVEEM